ncbi:MAG: hypothetical protein Q8J87_09825, partial [Sediminibacterium sp.]|nr:hypothetical protein [Sediminibacterium sp.]
KDSGVLKAFKKLTEDEQNEIIRKITFQKSDEKQVKMILKYIDLLSKLNKDANLLDSNPTKQYPI